MTDRLLWVWLSLACGAGSRVYNKLFTSFSTLREIYDAPYERFIGIDGIDVSAARSLADKDTDTAEAIMAVCAKNGWGVLTYGDRIYPKRLKMLPDPPVVLYVRGNLLDLNESVPIAVVGTRRMTEYGERLAYRLSYAMAVGGAVIVSGMALGCDAMAANGALDAGAPTVAVLGCGLDITYPKQHKTLEDHIARGGMIITEYPPGSPPEGAHFPVRNRIISGLSQGTLVVEAPLRSGALITARTSIAQGRDIFAVPGEVGRENSAGCNELIKDGAKTVTSAADILGVYEFIYPHSINVEAAIKAELSLGSGSGHESASMRMIASRPGIGERRAEKRAKKQTRRKLQDPPSAEEESFSFEEQRREFRAEKAPLSDGERAVYEAMGDGEVTPDELTSRGFSASDIMSSLTMLELFGYVTAVPGGRYRREK